MTNREIIDCIDRGANYYVSLFGRAEHMEIVQREHYSLVRPKGDVFGIRFVYDVRLEGLPLQRQKELAAEIHALGMPVWLNLGTSPEAFQAFTGREKQDVPQDSDGESYLAMLPGEMPAYPAFPQVTEAKTQPEFARWAETVNQVLSGGKEDIHPQYHYPLCRDGLMRCYMVQDREGRALSAARGWPGPCAAGPWRTPSARGRKSSPCGPLTAGRLPFMKLSAFSNIDYTEVSWGLSVLARCAF